MLDIVLNHKLAYSHSDDLLRGGVEGARIGGQHRMCFDTEDAAMNARILRSLMLELGDATWFLTITFNHNASPGLARWTEAVKLNGVHPQLYQHHVMRQMSYSWRRLQAWIRGPAQPLGPVTHVWKRWEMQPDCGNFPHIHALIWTSVKPKEAMSMATGILPMLHAIQDCSGCARLCNKITFALHNPIRLCKSGSNTAASTIHANLDSTQ